jgi:hypothetical protein
MDVFEYIEKLHSRITQLSPTQEEWFYCGWEARIDVYRRVGGREPKLIPSIIPFGAVVSYRALYIAASFQRTVPAEDKAREREFQYQYRWLVDPYPLVHKLRLQENPLMECALPSSLPSNHFSTKGTGGHGPAGAITAWPLGSVVTSTKKGYHYPCRRRDANTEFMYVDNEEG